MIPAVFAGTMCGQIFSNASLTGKYFVRHVQFTVDSGNNATDTRSIGGTITFDGAGNYAFTGTQVIGKAPAGQYSSSGTYAMQPSGIVTLTNPQTATLTLNARFGAEMVIGSSTEAPTNTYDFFVAIPAPSASQTNASLTVGFIFADWELPNASTSQVSDSIGLLLFDGAGGFTTSGKVTGHGAAIAAGATQAQNAYSGSYSVSKDGTGTLQFVNPGLPAGTALLGSASRNLYLSATGNVVLAGTPGGHDILIGLHDSPADNVTAASFNGRFWISGFGIGTGGSTQDQVGSLTVIPTDSAAVLTQREHLAGFGQADITSASYYTAELTNKGNTLVSAGPGTLGPGNNNTFILATVGANLASGQPAGVGSFTIAAGERIPDETGPGVFINPQGVVNAASNAPVGEPISPGEFIAIYGSGLANSTAVATPPYPAALGGVTVSIGGLPAPLYLVSSGQINALVPYAVNTSGPVPVIVTNGTASNTVNVPIAPTAPGVFSKDQSGAGEGAITHNTTGAVVSSANPAVAGEVLVAYLTGLGALQTSVKDGTAPGGVDSAVIGPQVQVQVDGVNSPQIYYVGINPVFPGLYQIDFQMPQIPDHGQDVSILIIAGTGATQEVLLFAQ